MEHRFHNRGIRQGSRVGRPAYALVLLGLVLGLDSGCFLKPKTDDSSPSSPQSNMPAETAAEEAPSYVEPAAEVAAPTVSGGETGYDSFRIGTEYLEQGKNTEAIRELQAALAQNPQFAEAWFNIGIAHQRTGNLNAAEEAYRKTLEIKPDMTVAMVNLAEVHRLKGEFDRALDLLQRAERQTPRNSLVRNQRVAVLRAMGRNDDAIGEARSLIEENSNDEAAFINLALAYHAKNDLNMACLVYEKALASFPSVGKDPFVLYDYGKVLLEMKERRRASLEGFDPAIQLAPNYVPALVARANLYLEDSENDKALELLKRAVDAEPTNIQGRLSLALAQRRAGDYESAKAQYDIVLTANPQHYQALVNAGILASNYLSDQEKALDYFRRAREVATSDAQKQQLDSWIAESEKMLKRAADQRAKDIKRQQEEAARKAADEAAKAAQPATVTPDGATPPSPTEGVQPAAGSPTEGAAPEGQPPLPSGSGG